MTTISPGQLEGEDGEQMTYTETLIKLKDKLSAAQTENKQAQLKLKHAEKNLKKMESSCKQVLLYICNTFYFFVLKL